MSTQEVRRAYLLAGLPGSGKTTAAEIGEALTGGSIIRVGKVIRWMAENDGVYEPSSEDLGRYAADKREENGASFFSERIVGMILRGELDVEYPVFVDSVRHVDGVVEFRRFFDTSFLLWIQAEASTRLERLRKRGRDGEEDFDIGDLLERDRREMGELGAATILESDQIDLSIPNDKDKSHLRHRLIELIG